jgi:hypothetical protein
MSRFVTRVFTRNKPLLWTVIIVCPRMTVYSHQCLRCIKWYRCSEVKLRARTNEYKLVGANTRLQTVAPGCAAVLAPASAHGPPRAIQIHRSSVRAGGQRSMGTEEDVVSSPPQSWQQTVWASSPPTAGSPLPLATHAQGEREEQRSRRQLRLFVQRANAARVPPPAWCGCWWASVCSIGLIWAGLLPRLPWVLLPMGLPDNCAKLIVTSTNSLPSLSKRKKTKGASVRRCVYLSARARSVSFPLELDWLFIFLRPARGEAAPSYPFVRS